MLRFFYRAKTRIVFSTVIALLGIAMLIQGIIGIFYAYESKNSSQEMTSLIIDNDTLNLSSLLSRVDSLISLIESDDEYLFTPAHIVTNDLITDSKTFNAMNSKLRTLVETNITEATYNNSFLFLLDSMPITYVAPEYHTVFDISSHPNSFGIYAANSIKTLEWFQNMKNSVDAYIWVENVLGRDILCYARNVYQKTIKGSDVDIRPTSVFYISFDLASLLNQLKLSELYPQYSVTLLFNDNIIYSNAPVGVENASYDFTYTSSIYPGLKLSTHLPKKSVNFSYYVQFFITLIILALLLILGVILHLYVYTGIIMPIEKMTQHLLKKEKIPHSEQQKMVPEITLLYQSHNIMLDRVNEAMIKSRNSYYKMLQSQINPHFTYNVLNSISAISLMKGDYEISETISNLVDMLRYGINSPETLVSLSEELAISEKFVAIQNFRYNNEVVVEYEIPDELLNIKMPKLTIQPLIENSIFHCDSGLNDKNIHIKVSVTACNKVASITIHDNNKVDAAILNEHLQHEDSINKSERRGLGIYNINQRLELIFGDGYGLHYESDSSGLCTIVTLPVESTPVSSQKNII